MTNENTNRYRYRTGFGASVKHFPVGPSEDLHVLAGVRAPGWWAFTYSGCLGGFRGPFETEADAQQAADAFVRESTVAAEKRRRVRARRQTNRADRESGS